MRPLATSSGLVGDSSILDTRPPPGRILRRLEGAGPFPHKECSP
jgi:hypothetical protein